MSDTPWQVYPAWAGRLLGRNLRWLGFLTACLLLAYVVTMSVFCLAPAGPVLFQPVTGGRPAGWPLACAECGLETEHFHVPFLLLDLLFFALPIAGGCYLAVRRSLASERPVR